MKLKVHTQGQGPDIVLIHGFGFHAQVFKPFINQQKKFRTHCIDLPGYGASRDFALIENIDNLCETILQCVPEKSIYCGWSMGGLMTLRIAKLAPHRVRALINCASSPYFLADNNWPGIQPDNLDHFSQDLCDNFSKTLQRFLNLQLLNCDNRRHLTQQLAPSLTALPPETTTLQHSLNLLKMQDFRKEISNLPCPQHHIFGQLDTIVPSATAAQITQLHPKANVTLIPKAAHTPFLSHPHKVWSIIEET